MLHASMFQAKNNNFPKYIFLKQRFDGQEMKTLSGSMR